MASTRVDVLNRRTGDVQFTAEIECAEDTPVRVKTGLVVRWAHECGADMREAYLSDAVLNGAVLNGADMREAVLRDAYMRDADLNGADLRGADLRGADLRGADLRGADLRDADLNGADLRGADLRDADLNGADLRGADLYGADLRGADLRDADLYGADLRGARVIFAGADERGYEFYLTASTAPNDIVIRAGCRRWGTFAEARAHYTRNYASNGKVLEILAKLDLLESIATARGYLTVESVKAA